MESVWDFGADYVEIDKVPLTVAQTTKMDVRPAAYHWFGLGQMIVCVYGVITAVLVDRSVCEKREEDFQSYVQALPADGCKESVVVMLGPSQSCWCRPGSAAIIVGAQGGNEAEPELCGERRLNGRRLPPTIKTPAHCAWLTNLCLDRNLLNSSMVPAIASRLVHAWPYIPPMLREHASLLAYKTSLMQQGSPAELAVASAKALSDAGGNAQDGSG